MRIQTSIPASNRILHRTVPIFIFGLVFLSSSHSFTFQENIKKLKFFLYGLCPRIPFWVLTLFIYHVFVKPSAQIALSCLTNLVVKTAQNYLSWLWKLKLLWEISNIISWIDENHPNFLYRFGNCSDDCKDICSFVMICC